MVDISNAQEIATTTSGGLGEAEVGGPSFSIVPKTGGNQLAATSPSVERDQGMVGDNYSPSCRPRVTTPGRLFKLWDSNLGSAARSPRIACGSSSSSATRAATGRFQACSPIGTWATPRNGTMRPIAAVRRWPRAAGATRHFV